MLKYKFNTTFHSVGEAEDIDVFGADFSINSNETFFNPYNLGNVSDLCENLTSDGGVKKLLIKRGTGPVVPADANVTGNCRFNWLSSLFTLSPVCYLISQIVFIVFIVKYVAFTEFAKAPFDQTTKPYSIDIG